MQLAILLLIAGAMGLWFGFGFHILVLWLATICLGAAGGILGRWIIFPRQSMVAAPIVGDEFRLRPRQTWNERFSAIATPLAIGTVTWIIPAVPLVCSAFVFHPRPFSPEEMTFLVSGAGVMIGLLVLLLYSRKVGRHRLEPMVTLNTDHPRLDAPFEMHIGIESPRPIHIADCRACVRCFEHILIYVGRFTHLVIRKKSEQIVPLAENFDLTPGQTFSTAATVTLDRASHLSTGKGGISMYPFYHWEIQIQVNGKSTSSSIFPINVDKISREQALSDAARFNA